MRQNAGSQRSALIRRAFHLRPLLQCAVPNFPFREVFERSAQGANPRLIIPPADKRTGVYFAPTQGTNFNSRHIFVPEEYHNCLKINVIWITKTLRPLSIFRPYNAVSTISWRKLVLAR